MAFIKGWNLPEEHSCSCLLCQVVWLLNCKMSLYFFLASAMCQGLSARDYSIQDGSCPQRALSAGQREARSLRSLRPLLRALQENLPSSDAASSVLAL